MARLKLTATFFYGLAIAGIGVLQIIFSNGFRPVILPIPPEDIKSVSFLPVIAGILLVIAGLLIAFTNKIKMVALLLAVFLLLLFLAGHLPNRLKNNPGMIGAWTDALKILALAGGALIVSGRSWGKYFFGIMLIVFGIDHFVYPDFVKTLVPTWIPGNLFWTYFCGSALIASGLAIIINFKPRVIGLLLALMLFLWLIMLHIPRAVQMDAKADNGNEWISVCECLAFCGMAILYPAAKKAP